MKKTLISGGVVALLVMLIVSSAGCTTPTTTSSSKDLTLTVTPKGETTSIGTLSKADNGSKYVLYNAVLKNIDVKGLDVNPFWFDMRLSNGSSVSVDLFATVGSPGGFPLTNATQPGDTVNGTIGFQIPQTATPVSITYDDLTYNVTANL